MESKPGDLEGLATTMGKISEEESKAAAVTKDFTKEAILSPKEEQSAPVVEGRSNSAELEEYPDPDEDDLDDLDDMLDEFIPSVSEPKAPSNPLAPVKPPFPTDLEADGLSDDDFAKQLQAGMAGILGELETDPEMQAQFEAMLKELGGAAAAGAAAESVPSTAPTSKAAPTSSKNTAGTPASAEKSFEDTIKKTMERMQASGASATAAASSTGEEDMLAEMMKAMGGLDGADGSEEDFSKMLMGMMEQLTNKEILYEPMKELHEKFPDWMKKNGGNTPAADMDRYKQQQIYVKEIVGRFERNGYSDDNAQDREYIVGRMQNMQAAGSPPPDLVGSMEAAQEVFGAPEEGCPTQ